MSNIDNGGPAFPTNYNYRANEHGMTMRDYFAAKAICGLLANSEPDADSEMVRRENYNEYCKLFAESAYEMADAMLKARKK